MVFSSYAFIFLFLPGTWLLFLLTSRFLSHTWSMAWLTIASLFFYAYWNPAYLPLILLSVTGNFWLARAMGRWGASWGKPLLITGIMANLGLLGWFKYLDFLVGNLNHFLEQPLSLPGILLPLGISFFTFQQIAFLVETERGRVDEPHYLNYLLCITFFPHLIAGPIIHPEEILSQLRRGKRRPFRWNNLSLGLTLFIVGLAKKLLIADPMGSYADPVFAYAAGGAPVPLLEAWAGALSYTFQLYFDFSGYSDMAIGLARLFGIRFPQNFNSPYQAVNIIDFWRRWHITLSRFLRNHLYIPLGGNRRGGLTTLRNLLITMLLGGLWHGAHWTFVVWGGMHGLALIVNHLWREWNLWQMPRWFARLLTFLMVVVGWIYFRAPNLSVANSLLQSLLGVNGLHLHQKWLDKFSWLSEQAQHGYVVVQDTHVLINTGQVLGHCLVLWAAVWFLPNIYQWLAPFHPVIEPCQPLVPRKHRLYRWIHWFPHPAWALLTAGLLGWSLLSIDQGNAFLYFQF
ncbi:MAG: MBOAT family protein [Magnetococcales bacterium]|nr:MBOAT family protein [Magnetococcales bacterium]